MEVIYEKLWNSCRRTADWYWICTWREAVQKAGSEDVVVEDQYVCENVDVEGEHDYDSIVSAIIMERYDANKRDAIFFFF